MNIISCSNYDEMSRLASLSVLSDLKKDTNQLLCPASGNSAIGVFKNMAQAYQEAPEYFNEARILMLDEWYGLAADHPNSCKAFLQEHLILPLCISEERYFYFKSDAPVAENECERMSAILKRQGPIDLCILGMGKNGHLGFNEPALTVSPHCHVAKLSDSSKNHAMISALANAPESGLTLGMTDILQSKKIILLLTGASKRNVIEKLLSKNITAELPASLLWDHPNVECYLDRLSITD
ncbi:MAG: 6-phosphogluconolactonase [Flavobacteriaceae bacterium]|nr:6-phosphogluconolactonase [Flavobacteriaceae bacterium]